MAKKLSTGRKTSVKLGSKNTRSRIEEEELEDLYDEEIEEEELEEESPRKSRRGGKGTSRKTSRGKGTARGKGSKRSRDEDDDEVKSGGKGMMVLGLVALLGLGGVGAWYAFKPDPNEGLYIASAQEKLDLSDIQTIRKNVSLNPIDAQKLANRAIEYKEKYAKSPKIAEEQLNELIVQCDEIVIASSRLKLFQRRETAAKEEFRLFKVGEAKKDQDAYLAKLKKEKEEQERLVAKLAREKRAALNASLNDNKESARWQALNVAVTLLDKNFVSARAAYTPYRTSKLDAEISQKDAQFAKEDGAEESLTDHVAWGYKMQKISNDAEALFNVFQNSTLAYRGLRLNWGGEKPKPRDEKPKLVNISKTHFEIDIIEYRSDGIPKTRQEEIPFVEYPAAETWNVIEAAKAKGKLSGKSDSQIKYEFACLLYYFQNFPAARKYLKESAHENADFVFAEIAAVEPRYNREHLRKHADWVIKEIALTHKLAAGNYLKTKVYPRFRNKDTHSAWEEFKAEFEDLQKQIDTID